MESGGVMKCSVCETSQPFTPHSSRLGGACATRNCQGVMRWTAAAKPVFNIAPLQSSRKDIPVATGVLDYFPDAIMEIAKLSKRGNDKHNPGEPLHWARGKSMDHADALLRHLMERGTVDPETGLSHTVSVAWRACAMLQEECEKAGAPVARGAR